MTTSYHWRRSSRTDKGGEDVAFSLAASAVIQTLLQEIGHFPREFVKKNHHDEDTLSTRSSLARLRGVEEAILPYILAFTEHSVLPCTCCRHKKVVYCGYRNRRVAIYPQKNLLHFDAPSLSTSFLKLYNAQQQSQKKSPHLSLPGECPDRYYVTAAIAAAIGPTTAPPFVVVEHITQVSAVSYPANTMVVRPPRFREAVVTPPGMVDFGLGPASMGFSVNSFLVVDQDGIHSPLLRVRNYFGRSHHSTEDDGCAEVIRWEDSFQWNWIPSYCLSLSKIQSAYAISKELEHDYRTNPATPFSSKRYTRNGEKRLSFGTDSESGNQQLRKAMQAIRQHQFHFARAHSWLGRIATQNPHHLKKLYEKCESRCLQSS